MSALRWLENQYSHGRNGCRAKWFERSRADTMAGAMHVCTYGPGHHEIHLCWCDLYFDKDGLVGAQGRLMGIGKEWTHERY